MRLLTSIDAEPTDLAARVMELGTPAVTVVCEAALGSYPGIRTKVRTNAVSLLGWLTHPQAAEAVVLLIGDENPDIASRAMHAAGRSADEAALERIAAVLSRPETLPILAAEGVRGLATAGTPAALAVLESYRQAGDDVLQHRGTAVVRTALEKGPRL